MKVSYSPSGYRIKIRAFLPEAKSAGGIFLDANINDKEDSELAEVLEVGPTAFNEKGDGEPWVVPGDKILIARYCGKKLPYLSEVQRIINDKDVIAKVNIEE